MNTFNFPTSACRLCRYYQPEGRRGGTCQQLSVPVRAEWKACSLALPPFTSSWEKIEQMWQREKLILQQAIPVNCSLEMSDPSPSEERLEVTAEKFAVDAVLV